MLVEADAVMVVALRAHQELAPERPLRFQRMLDAIVLRARPLPIFLVVLAEGRDDVVRSAEFRERRLDARAARLVGLDENESMLVRNDHEPKPS